MCFIRYSKALLLHFVFLFTVSSALAQADTATEVIEIRQIVKETFGKIMGNDPTVIGDLKIEKKSSGERELSGPVSLFGKGDLKLTGILRSNLKPSAFKVEFPASAIINLSNLDAFTGGSLREYIPNGFPIDAGIAIRLLEINFDTSGYIPEKIVTAFANSRPFGLMGDGILTVDKTELEFIIDQPKNPTRKITGNLKGGLRLGSANIDLGAVLSTRKEDIKFSGSVSSLTLHNLLSSIGGASIVNTMPASLSSLGLSSLNFEIHPFRKIFSVLANSSFGEIELQMSPGKNGGKMQFLIGIAPPQSFKFSSFDQSLSLLDGIDLSGTAMVISDYAGNMESSLKTLRSSSGQSQQLVQGLNVFSRIKLGDELGQFLGKPELELYGSLDKSLNVNMAAALNFDNLKLAEGFYFKEVKFGMGFRPGSGKVNFRLSGRMEAMIKNDLLSFNAGFDFSPTDVQLNAFFLMEAIKKANAQAIAATRNAYNEIEPPEWNEPFGVKAVGLRKLGFSVGVSPKSPIFLSSLGITADVRLGINPDFKKNITGAFTTNLDIANPLNSMLDVKLKNLTIIGMIDAFRPNANISGTLRSWLDWGLENAYLRIVPESKVYLPDNKHYERGVLAGGTLKLGGLSATAELAVSDAGFGFKAMIDPIDYSTGGFTWFALKGYEQGNKAQVNLQLNASDPELIVDGDITVLGISARTSIKVNSKGAKFKVEGNAAGGTLNASLEVEAQQLSATSGFKVKAVFNNQLQDEVVKQLIDFIKRESAKSQAAYSDAQNSLQRAKNAAGNDAEKGLIDMANGFVTTFKEIDKGMAVAGQYVAKGLIGDAINIRKIFFESNLTRNQLSVAASIDMTIAGKQIIQSANIDLNITAISAMAEKIVGQIKDAVVSAFESVGGEIEKGWNDFVNGANQFFNQAGKGFQQLGKEFEKAGAAAVNWIEGAATTIYNWGDETFNGARVEGPSFGNPPSMIPFDVTKYTVTITGIRVDRIPSTNLGILGTSYPDGNELEIFGSITIIPSGRLWTNAGSNRYGLNLRQGDNMSIANGTTRGLSSSKNFYCKDVNTGMSYITIYTHIFDNDDQNIFTSAFVANEEMRNTIRVNLAGIQPGQSVPGQVSAMNRDNDHGVTVFYTVSASPKVSHAEMINAVNSRNAGIVESTIRRGGNPFNNELMTMAIRNNDAGSVQMLSRYGVSISSSDMNLALANAPNMLETLINLGGVPGINELLKAVELRNVNLVNFILRKGVQPNVPIVRRAIELKDHNMVSVLTQKGVLLGTAELELAMNQGDAGIVRIVLNSGAVPTQAMILSSLRNRLDGITQLLVKKITPGQETLQEAANQNNTAMFKLLTESGGILQNNSPLFTAIDNNNRDILLLGLKSGGNPTEALKHAVQKNNTDIVLFCLDNRGDPSAAIGYAVKTNNMNLVNALLTTYKVNPNECMGESIAAGNIAAATAALATGGVISNSFMAAAAEKNNTALVKALTESRGDPNLAMPAAVRLNNTEMASYLISKGASTSNTEFIIKAAQSNYVDMVRILVSNGADVNAGIPYAIDTKNPVLIKYLLENGASPHGLIHKPAADGNLEIVKMLLDKGAIPDEGMQAGVKQNHTAVVKMLLIAGAKPHGFVHIPASKNNIEMVADLLQAGANPDHGMRAAVDGNFNPIVKMLLDKGASAGGYLQKPASIGNLEMVQMLLNKNADPNEGIEASIRGNHTTVIKLLVTKGANGNRLLAIPSSFGNLEIVELLLSKGANPELGIKVAVDKLHTPVVQVLINAGADGSKKEYMDITVAKNFAPLVPVLVKAGNKIDSTVTDAKGRTHLHNAAELDNSLALVKALLEAGAPLNVRDNDGNSPLHLAVDEGRDDIETVKILLEAGADPCAVNNKKKNVYKQANRSKVKKLIKDFGGSRKCAED